MSTVKIEFIHTICKMRLTIKMQKIFWPLCVLNLHEFSRKIEETGFEIFGKTTPNTPIHLR